MRKRILIVQDNSDLFEILQNILKHLGYECIWAANGRKAVGIASSRLPDVILLSNSLPDMDGLAAARLIRGNLKTHSIPIITVTGRNSFKELDGCLSHSNLRNWLPVLASC